MLNYMISVYHDNQAHGDDCFKIFKSQSSNDVIAIVCDGVSSSTSGRVASFLTTNAVFSHFENELPLNDKPEFLFFQEMLVQIQLKFEIFNNFLKHYQNTIGSNDGFNLNKLPSDVASENGVYKTDYDNQNKSIQLYKQFHYYCCLFEFRHAHFYNFIRNLNLNDSIFCTTLNILWLSKIDNQFWKAVCFNLGDGYLVQTNMSNPHSGPDFKDIFFSRSIETNPPQITDKIGIKGEFDFKTLFFPKDKVISLGTDGTKIKNPDYSKPSYQYEYFREFAEFLTVHKNDFENSAELWFKHLKKKTSIDDDFTLINIYVN